MCAQRSLLLVKDDLDHCLCQLICMQVSRVVYLHLLDSFLLRISPPPRIIDETHDYRSSTFTHQSVYMTTEARQKLAYQERFKNFKIYCHMMIQDMSFDV